MKRSLRVVNYAVNGSGAGHLTRLVAISRWIRRYAAWADVRAEIYFLTSSEAEGLPLSEGFASFKLPSKTVVGAAGIDKATYLALAKQWVWHSIGLVRPDLFVVDTFPRGSFGELMGVLDLCKKRALIYRPMLDDFARRPDVQTLLPLYDTVIVPEHEGESSVLIPDAARPRTRFVGPIAVRERVELMSRDAARDRLGIARDARVVYVSAGGGGDARAEAQLLRSVEALLAFDPAIVLVLGTGPLYRGRVPRHARLTPLVNEPAAELGAAFDVAVSAAGYNSAVELMLAGVPTVFVPQDKIADDQGSRAMRAVRAGAARMLSHDAPPTDLTAAVADLLEPATHRAAALAAKKLVPKNCARVAAAELLRTCLPTSDVDRAEVAVSDALIEQARALEVDEVQLIEMMHLLDGDGGRASPARELGELLQRSQALFELARDAKLPAPRACEVAREALRKNPEPSVARRRDAVAEALLRSEPAP